MAEQQTMFGVPPEHPNPVVDGQPRRDPRPGFFWEANPKKRGYAAQPGTGPEGETCKTCFYYAKVEIRSGRTFSKCEFLRRNWTHSYGTDILLKAPACEEWRPLEGRNK